MGCTWSVAKQEQIRESLLNENDKEALILQTRNRRLKQHTTANLVHEEFERGN